MKKAKRKGRWLHKANGGTAIVLGGVYIITEPGDLPARYKIAVGCLGHPPSKEKSK